MIRLANSIISPELSNSCQRMNPNYKGSWKDWRFWNYFVMMDKFVQFRQGMDFEINEWVIIWNTWSIFNRFNYKYWNLNNKILNLNYIQLKSLQMDVLYEIGTVKSLVILSMSLGNRVGTNLFIVLFLVQQTHPLPYL